VSLYIFIRTKRYFVVNGQILVPIIWPVSKSFSFHGFKNAHESFIIYTYETNSLLHIWYEFYSLL